ncbi:uncharacterized protein LOC127845694 [Dreissena polymorpha]|nr:uncharacterized protein LOC127845694 [Dreissena polymorpha]
MDAEMDDPTKSIIWSEKFLGNGDGFVTTGPFANFKAHTSDSILMRNIGVSGSLMTNEGIHGVLSQNRTADISNPRAPKQNNLELQHNTVHAWIGGNMDDLSQSCEDPVFYMHHAFVDYLWEEFRTRQKMVGIDPETDYPDIDWGEHQHAPDAPLGFGDLRNIDALSNVFADLVKYDPSPVCTRTHPTCISKFLRCDASRAYPVCVSLSREELNSETERPSELCVEAQMTRAVQNSFSINLHCDVRKWVYIPVKIVLQRPPEFSNYKAYPVLNNEPVRNTDVFSTISIDKNISHHLAAYPNCKITSSAARKIFIESNGLNYYGKYKDFTILDQRHALSSATTYLGVKSPESNHTDVIVTAFDYCGRTCRPFCLDITVSPPKSRPCSGVIRVTEDEPKQYGHNYAEAVNMRWSASGPDELPEEAPFHFITFYCDYSGHWPWDESIQRSVHGSKNIFNTPQLRESFDGHFQEKIPGINSPPPQFPHSHSHSTRLLPPPSLLPPTGPQAVSKSQNDKNESAKFTKPLIKTSPRITIIRAKSRRPDPKQEISLPAIQAAVSATRIPNIRTLNLSSATSRPAGQLHRRQQHPVPQQSLRQFHLSQTTPWNIATPLSQPAVVNTRQERLSTFTAPTSSNRLFNQERFSDFLSQSPQRAPDMIAFRDGCRLNRACQLAMSCSPCRHKARQPCLPPSRLVAICLNGVYTVENRFVEFTG